MKKKNGMTMMEIMISVVLISLVMIFVFNILVDLRQEETLSKYKSSDQINRSIITRTIQKDFLDKGLMNIVQGEGCPADPSTYVACLDAIFADGDKRRIYVEKKAFYYGEVGNLEKWTLDATSYKQEFSLDIYYAPRKTEEERKTHMNYFLIKLLFPVDLTGDVLESKMIFDIELLYEATATMDEIDSIVKNRSPIAHSAVTIQNVAP